VGNFPYECSQEEVVGLFTANACAILDVRMVRNRDTDRPRGYFLEFEDLPSLERALGFDQYVLGGRPLRVNVAEGRPERRDRDRDRYGGGGGFAERYDRDRGGGDGRRGGFAERYADGPRDAGFVGGGASFGRREGGGGYQEAREGRGGRNSRMHDDDRPRRRSFDRPADRVLPSDGPAPEGRKKLVLAARSVPADGGAAPETPENKADASSKPNPFGAARPVDSSAKIAEAERKIKEERDALHAKAGAKAEGGVPAPKPKPLSKSSVQPPVTKRGPLIMAPKEEPVIKAKNAFELLSMDDSGDDEDDEEE
jgi:translation initiation factor 4B